MSDAEVNKTDTGSIHWKKEQGKLYVTTKENTTDPPSEPWIELTTQTKADVVNKLKKQIIGEEPQSEDDVEDNGEDNGEDTWKESTGGKKSKKRRNKNKRHTRKNKNRL
jgi:hypothetical protein